MHEEMAEYYATNKLYLSRIGVWPYQHKVVKLLLPAFLTIIQFSILVPQIILIHDTWGDIDVLVESVVVILANIGGNVKMINLVINNNKFRSLLQLMSNHWSIFNSKSERDILKHYAHIGRKVTKYLTVYYCTAAMLYSIVPLIPKFLDIVIPLNESRPLKYVCGAEYRVDKEKYYYPILIHSDMATTILIMIILSTDSIYIICVLHACSLFAAISHRLENIVGQTNVKTSENEKTVKRKDYLFVEGHDYIKSDCHELTICLKKHQLVLEYVQILDSTFTHMMFIILFYSVLLLTIMGIQVLNKLGDTEEVIRYICVAASSFIHLVGLCFPGQLLIDSSKEVSDKAYSSRWYTFSAKSKTLLKILLYRTYVPSTISAGKMFIMSMSMISTVTQTAMSYFTTLASLK